MFIKFWKNNNWGFKKWPGGRDSLRNLREKILEAERDVYSKAYINLDSRLKAVLEHKSLEVPMDLWYLDTIA